MTKDKDPQPLVTVKPEPVQTPDFSALAAYVKENFDHVAEQGYEMDDFDNHATEYAMEAVFGKDVWAWYNKHNRLLTR